MNSDLKAGRFWAWSAAEKIITAKTGAKRDWFMDLSDVRDVPWNVSGGPGQVCDANRTPGAKHARAICNGGRKIPMIGDMRNTRLWTIALVAVLVPLMSGCVDREVNGDAVQFSFSTWVPIVVLLVGLAAAPIGLMFRESSKKVMAVG